MQTSQDKTVSNPESTQPIITCPPTPDLPLDVPSQVTALPNWLLTLITVTILVGRLTGLAKQTRRLLLTLYGLARKWRKKPEKPQF